MEKKHELPEFQVIRQNQANAKFFVASFENEVGNSTTPSQPKTTSSVASNYSGQNDVDDLW